MEIALLTQPPWLLLLLPLSLGLFSVARLALVFLWWCYAFFLRPTKNLKTRYGSWAIVTGATDGIGRAIAFELARHGLGLILVGRSPDKLHAVTAAIKQDFPSTLIQTIVIDFSGDMTDGLLRLREVVEGLDVGVLINNAGVANTSAMLLHEGELGTWTEIMKVNVEALTEVTHAVLPGMVERRRGAIVNIGSGSAAVIPSYPLFSVYSATKAYVDQFSRSLHIEYKNYGIDVQCQLPLYVATRMVSKVAKLRWFDPFVASPEAYARAAVKWIGYESRCMPYLPHFLQWWMASLVPVFIHDKVMLHVNMNQRKALKRHGSSRKMK